MGRKKTNRVSRTIRLAATLDDFFTTEAEKRGFSTPQQLIQLALTEWAKQQQQQPQEA